MNLTYCLIAWVLLIAFQIQGEPLETSIKNNDTLPDKEVFEMLEAMKLPEKLKEIFLKMKNDLLFQGLDQSGPFNIFLSYVLIHISSSAGLAMGQALKVRLLN